MTRACDLTILVSCKAFMHNPLHILWLPPWHVVSLSVFLVCCLLCIKCLVKAYKATISILSFFFYQKDRNKETEKESWPDFITRQQFLYYLSCSNKKIETRRQRKRDSQILSPSLGIKYDLKSEPFLSITYVGLGSNQQY